MSNSTKTRTLTLLLILFIAFGLEAQTKSNLEKIFELVDKSTEKISPYIQSLDTLSISFESPSEYDFLRNRLLKNLAGMSTVSDSADYTLVYTVVNASVNYDNIFREWFLGDFKIVRDVSLTADYFLTGKGGIIKSGSFAEAMRDTVDYDRVKTLENFSLPFTKGKLPPEPFFSGLLEPVVAIGSAVVAVYLLFSVRSK